MPKKPAAKSAPADEGQKKKGGKEVWLLHISS